METVRAGTAAIRVAVAVALPVVALGGSAHAEPTTVPLLLVDPPAAFDSVRFSSALDTYVPNARVALGSHAAGDPAAICGDAVVAARAVQSPIALWARWENGTLVIERVGEAGCGAIGSSTVDIAPDQAAFVYRVAALKVASLVRELPDAAPAGEAAAARAPVAAVVEAPPSTDARAHSIEVGASGIASPRAADRVALASVGAWVGGRWELGGTAMISAAVDEEGPGGRGSARVFGAFAGLRRTLTGGAAWRLDFTGELGVLGVRSVSTRTGSSVEMSDDVWTPTAAVAPRIWMSVAGPLGLALGPTLEASTRSVRLTLGDTPLYNAGLVRLRFDVRAELRF